MSVFIFDGMLFAISIVDSPNPMLNPKTLDKSSHWPEKDRYKTIISMSKRDTFKYELYNGKRLVYVGTTNDLNRRESEHRNDGMEFTSMRKIGNATTKEAAGEWEENRIGIYKNSHGGDRPKYNQNDSGK